MVFSSSQRHGIALSTRHPAVSRLEGDPVVSGSQPLKQVRDRNRSGMQGEHGPCNDSRYVAAVLSGSYTLQVTDNTAFLPLLAALRSLLRSQTVGFLYIY